MSENIYIGLDIGGTKFMVHSTSQQGKEIKCIKADTPYELDKGLELIFEMIESVSRGYQILGIGAAIGGPLDIGKGLVSPLHQPTWRNVPLKQIIEDKYKVPFYFDIDTNAASLAEYYLGKYTEKKFLYITLSTGMGGGFIIDGNIYRGLSHPELAHQSIPYKCSYPERIECECGAGDCLEAIISGNGIARIYNKLASQLNADEWKEVAYNLGMGLRNIACIMSPEVIVLGGGVITKQGNKLLSDANQIMCNSLKLVTSPKLKLSDLDYNTALYGSSFIAREGAKFYK